MPIPIDSLPRWCPVCKKQNVILTGAQPEKSTFQVKCNACGFDWAELTKPAHRPFEA
jgi:hypothetical protein